MTTHGIGTPKPPDRCALLRHHHRPLDTARAWTSFTVPTSICCGGAKNDEHAALRTGGLTGYTKGGVAAEIVTHLRGFRRGWPAVGVPHRGAGCCRQADVSSGSSGAPCPESGSERACGPSGSAVGSTWSALESSAAFRDQTIITNSKRSLKLREAK
jgi:hypothetical protein